MVTETKTLIFAGTKAFAFGAAAFDAMLIAANVAQANAPSAVELATAAGAGGLSSVGVWWFLKEYLKRHDRQLERLAETKVDKEYLELIREDLQDIKRAQEKLSERNRS